MLLNCLHCGKSVSSKKDVCVYCATDLSLFISEFKNTRVTGLEKNTPAAKEKYAGTFISLLIKTKG